MSVGGLARLAHTSPLTPTSNWFKRAQTVGVSMEYYDTKRG